MNNCITYSLKDVSALLGVSYNTVYSWVRSNFIPNMKLGGQYMIPRAEFDNWLSSHIQGGDIS